MQGMDPATREQFNNTYKLLLDSLNDKKKAGVKYDFATDLRTYERDHEIDTICFFRVRYWTHNPTPLLLCK